MTPTITVCTDASVNMQHEIAAWATYIRLPDQVIKTGSTLKLRTHSSTDAEMHGLANALYIVDSMIDLSKYRLIVYCDNIDALGKIVLSKRKNKISHTRLRFFDENILAIANQAKSYEFRHVKGHLKESEWSKTSKRNYMNDWCDKEARRIMRQELKLVKPSSTLDGS